MFFLGCRPHGTHPVSRQPSGCPGLSRRRSMSPVPSPAPGLPGEIPALLRRLGPEVERLLEGADLSNRETEEILREVLILFAHQWDRIESREIWLLTMVKRLRERRTRLVAMTSG